VSKEVCPRSKIERCNIIVINGKVKIMYYQMILSFRWGDYSLRKDSSPYYGKFAD
jgi:hypothetical protein